MLKLLDKINFKIGRLFIGWRDKNPDDPFPRQEGVNADGYNPNDLNWELFVIQWDGKHYIDEFIVCYRIKQ